MVVGEEAWYGPLLTCCTCGESWQDGERLPRPFRRGWRAESAARARATWSAAGTRKEAMDWLMDELGVA